MSHAAPSIAMITNMPTVISPTLQKRPVRALGKAPPEAAAKGGRLAGLRTVRGAPTGRL